MSWIEWKKKYCCIIREKCEMRIRQTIYNICLISNLMCQFKIKSMLIPHLWNRWRGRQTHRHTHTEREITCSNRARVRFFWYFMKKLVIDIKWPREISRSQKLIPRCLMHHLRIYGMKRHLGITIWKMMDISSWIFEIYACVHTIGWKFLQSSAVFGLFWIEMWLCVKTGERGILHCKKNQCSDSVQI